MLFVFGALLGCDSSSDAPPVAHSQSVEVIEDGSLQIVLSGSDTDSTISSFTVITLPTHGALTILGAIVASVPHILSSDTLVYTPEPEYFGPDEFEFSASSNSRESGIAASAAATVSIIVSPANDPPVFTAGTDHTVPEDAGAQLVAGWATDISAGAANESSQLLAFVVTNDNEALFVSQPAISPAGDLTYAPAADAYGSADVTVVLVDDGGGDDTSAPATFRIEVTAMNDPPIFAPGANQVVVEDASLQLIAGWATSISAGATNESSQTLAFVVTHDNEALFVSQPAISPAGDLTYAPAADAYGSADVTVVLVDDGGGDDTSAPAAFRIEVTPMNDPPSFAPGANQVVVEDASPQLIAGWATSISAGATNESGQALAFTVSNDDNTLFVSQPSISPAGDLAYALVADAHGSAEVTVALVDDGGGEDTSTPVTFTIDVTPVNDPPSFTAGANQSVLEDAGPQMVVDWASDISPGPADESGQAMGFLVSNDNSALFSTQPSVTLSGELTYTPGADANGTALVTVALQDDGSGDDTSSIHVLSITVGPVNDAPYAVDDTASTNGRTSLNLDVLGNDGDVEGDGLIVTDAFSPTFGSVTLESDSTITFDPDPAYRGTCTFTYEIDDANGGTGTGTVTIYVGASYLASPTLTKLHALEGSTVSVSAEVTLTLSGEPGASWEGTAAVAAPWLSVTPSTGALSDGESVTLTVSADPAGLADNIYLSEITITDPGLVIDPLVIPISLAVRPAAPNVTAIVYYTSRIDHSEQPYGIRLPSGFSGSGNHPVALAMHGYGGHASTSFDASAIAAANAGGWILVNVEGRGNHFYDGAAEVDLFEILEDIDNAYGVDWTRVFLEGASMGATGAFRHIARHPDVFAAAAGSDGWTDYYQWHRHYYGLASPWRYDVHPSRYSNLEQTSPLTHAENILPDRAYIAVDGNDTSVWAESGEKLAARLDRLGTAHQHVLDPSGGHCGTYNRALIYPWLASRAPLELDPPALRFRSNRLRTAKSAWMRVDRFGWNGFAEVAATRDVGAAEFAIAMRNVERFTILSAPDAGGPYAISVNGVSCGASADFPLTIELALSGTGAVLEGAISTPPVGGGATKTASCEGPVGWAMTDRFIVAWGSSHAESTVNDKNRMEAEEFCRAWADDWTDAIDTPGNYGFNSVILPIDEVEIEANSIANSNLIIFGTEESSSYVARMCADTALPFNLPIRIAEDQILADGQTYVTPDHGIWMVYANPLAPSRLVVVGNNVVGSGADSNWGEILWTREAYPWSWPDYVVFDTAATMRPEDDGYGYAPDQWVAWGFFGRDWELVSESSHRTDVAILTPSIGAAFAAGTPTVTVTIDVIDVVGGPIPSESPVVGLSLESFALRIDGETLGVNWVGEIAAGQYELTIDSGLLQYFPSRDTDQTMTTYELTVEVVRPHPDTGEPLAGLSRTRFFIQ